MLSSIKPPVRQSSEVSAGQPIVGQADRLLRVNTVAKMLDVSPRTVRHWAAAGILRGCKLGPKLWVFSKSDVLAFQRGSGMLD